MKHVEVYPWGTLYDGQMVCWHCVGWGDCCEWSNPGCDCLCGLLKTYKE